MPRIRACGGAATGVALFALPLLASGAEKPSDKQRCIAAAEQGQSQRDDGQYRAARDSFLKCADEACPRVIVQSCTKWLRELDESAPTIVLGAKDEQGNDLTNVNVTFDGAAFATILTGKPMEVDAGEHVVRFERDGSAPVEQKLLLRAGERARVVSVTLVGVVTQTDAAVPRDAMGAHLGSSVAAPATFSSTRIVTSAAMGLGAVAAAVTAVVFVVQSNQKKDDAATLRSNLPSDACSGVASPMCTALSHDVHQQHDDIDGAVGFFVGAGALAAGALASWVFWPKGSPTASETTGWIEPVCGGATVQVAGRFR